MKYIPVLALLLLTACNSSNDTTEMAGDADSTLDGDITGTGDSGNAPIDDPLSSNTDESDPDTDMDTIASSDTDTDEVQSSSDPIITSNNAEAILKSVIDAGNADDFESILPYLQRVLGAARIYEPSDVVEGLSIIDDQVLEDDDVFLQSVRTTQFSCDAGGLFTRFVTSISGSSEEQIQGVAEQCRLDDVTLDGGFSGSSYRGNSELLFETFSITEGNGATQTLDGELVRLDFVSTEIMWSGSYESFDEQGNLVRNISEADLSVSNIPSSEVDLVRAWSAAFDLTTPATGDQPLTVNTLSIFQNEGQPDSVNYSVGRLEAVAADGSSLVLDADTGMIDTFSVIINGVNGSEQLTLDWSDELRIRCVDVYGSFGEEPPISTCQ